jgi:dTDP-4-dehydrorhamnose 3,5-epimerase
MKIEITEIKDVLLIQPTVFGDQRGFFQEAWNQKVFDDAVGENIQFVQDNHSRSSKGVLRGLHYQKPRPQGKLVRVVSGSVLDVAVDIRISSLTFGKYVAVELSEENQKQLWVPAGCAHGFFVLSESVDFLYKTTDFYTPDHEYCIQWNDQDLGIDWKLEDMEPKLSEKDLRAVSFKDAEYYI